MPKAIKNLSRTARWVEHCCFNNENSPLGTICGRVFGIENCRTKVRGIKPQQFSIKFGNWQTVLERIGEKRWQTQTLVEDYIDAMASMLTTKELENTLNSLGITNFQISDGRYINGDIKSPDNIKEYERDTEYVCIIQK